MLRICFANKLRLFYINVLTNVEMTFRDLQRSPRGIKRYYFQSNNIRASFKRINLNWKIDHFLLKFQCPVPSTLQLLPWTKSFSRRRKSLSWSRNSPPLPKSKGHCLLFFFKIYFNYVLPSTTRSAKLFIVLTFPTTILHAFLICSCGLHGRVISCFMTSLPNRLFSEERTLCSFL
jgi:hypothetical protein